MDGARQENLLSPFSLSSALTRFGLFLLQVAPGVRDLTVARSE